MGFFKGIGLREVYLGLMVILVGISSFGLGRLSALEGSKEELRICPDPGISTVAPEAKHNAALEEKRASASASAANAELGKYVASKQGSKYHLPWCSGAQRIRPENQIWFNSKEEAERAGYTPAANCKGL